MPSIIVVSSRLWSNGVAIQIKRPTNFMLVGLVVTTEVERARIQERICRTLLSPSYYLSARYRGGEPSARCG